MENYFVETYTNEEQIGDNRIQQASRVLTFGARSLCRNRRASPVNKIKLFNFKNILSHSTPNQCDQIGRFIGLWATF